MHLWQGFFACHSLVMTTRKTRKSKTAVDAIPFSLRLPPSVHEVLVEIAEREGKSLNSLMIELLQENAQNLKLIASSADGDLLDTAYYAIQAAEMYARGARGAIIRLQKETAADFPILEESAPSLLGEPIDRMSPILRELVAEVSALDEAEQEALLVLLGKKK